MNALRQGLESAQVALQATEAGYDVGTRTEVEVLQGRQSLVQAQVSYWQSRYDYMNNVIALRLAAGTLARDTLVELNKSLTALMGSPPPCPAVGQPARQQRHHPRAGAAPLCDDLQPLRAHALAGIGIAQQFA